MSFSRFVRAAAVAAADEFTEAADPGGFESTRLKTAVESALAAAEPAPPFCDSFLPPDVPEESPSGGASKLTTGLVGRRGV